MRALILILGVLFTHVHAYCSSVSWPSPLTNNPTTYEQCSGTKIITFERAIGTPKCALGVCLSCNLAYSPSNH